MNKRFLSTLLTGAIFLAATSMFVSCKDYDDDIKNLQAQIDKAALKTDLENLQNQLNAVKATADAAATKAELKALADAAATKTELAAVKTIAENAGTKAAEAISKAAEAQKTADAAVSAAAVAKAAADAAQLTADAAKALAEAAATKDDLAKVKGDLTTLANNAQSTADAALALAQAAATKVDFDKAVETLTKAAENAQKTADAAKKLAEAAATKADFDKAVADLTQAAADAQADAEAAQADVDALEEIAATKDELAAVKGELEKYADKVAKEAADAAETNAKTAAADALKKAVEDQAKVDEAQDKNLKKELEKYALNTEVKSLTDALGKRIDVLKEEVEKADEKIYKEIEKQVKTFKAIVSDLFTAVTSVELVASYGGYLPGDAYHYPLVDMLRADNLNYVNLGFKFGKQIEDEPFGNKEDNFEDADEIIEYFAGKDIRTKQAIVVRVNPTNATFTKDQVKFFDSEGNSLDEIIEIGDPYRYEGLITRPGLLTRGGSVENGLWVIPVNVAEDVEMEDFNSVTFAGRTYNEDGSVKNSGRQILYAVAICNATDPEADEDAALRYVASTYDLSTNFSPFVPSTTLDVEIGDGEEMASIRNYHNRWQSYDDREQYEQGLPWGASVTVPENEFEPMGYIHSRDQWEAFTDKNPEKAWILNPSEEDIEAGMVVPTATAKTDPINTINDGFDFRFGNEFYTLGGVGETIYMELPEYLKKTVEYWYVTYDFKLNAVESAPSEWEAWQSYRKEIDGIYKMTAGVDQIELTINAATALGDVIGFRVFAVNYDGSLVDPDGKAFYVKVGDIKTVTATAAGEFTAVKQSAGMSYDVLLGATTEDGYNVGIADVEQEFESLPLHGMGQGSAWVSADDENIREGFTAYYALLDEDGNLATNWAKIAKVKIGVRGADLNKIVDGATFNVTTISADKTDANNKARYILNITAKKNMPTEAVNGIVWKNGYENLTTVYVIPQSDGRFVPGVVDDVFYWNGGANLPQNANRIDGSDIANYQNWTTKATWARRVINNYVYDFESLLDNDDYRHQFVFHGLPTGLEAPADKADFTADFLRHSSTPVVSTPFIAARNVVVLPAAVDNKYAYDLNYVYAGISLKKDANGEFMENAARGDFDYPVKAASGETTFKSPLQCYNFSTSLKDLEINWSDYRQNTTALLRKGDNTYSNLLAEALWDVKAKDDASAILAEDAQLSILNNMEHFRPAEWFGLGENGLEVEITGNAMTYLDSNNDLSNLTFSKKGGNAQPTADQAGTIKITGYDCFGKKHSWTVTFTLKFNK